jgi:hypothetical protein
VTLAQPYTPNTSRNSVGTFSPRYRDIPPMHAERGSAFGWEEFIGGYEKGVVFATEWGLQREFQQMLDTDGKALSIENLLAYPILSAPFEIVGTEGDKGQADKIREILTAAPYEGGMATPLEIILHQMTAAMTFKKAFFEKIYCLRESDGLYGYENIAWRPQETCELALDAKTGRYRGFRQRKVHYEWRDQSANDHGYVNFDKTQAFVYIHGSWRDPLEGISSMQVPFWCHQTKRRLLYLWYQYLETTSLPKTIVKNQDENTAIRNAKRVATLKSRGVLGIGSDNELETLESAGHGATQFVEAIRYLDSSMSQSILAGFMDLSSMAAAGKGSFALSEDQSKLFLRTRRIVAWDMARQLNEQVIAPLTRFNFGRTAPCPRLVFGPMSEANEATVIEAFNAMMTAASTSTSSAGIAVPDEFYDELTVRVATILELDPEKVQKAIDNDGSPLEKLRNAAEVALGAMQANDAMMAGETEITPEQFLDEAAGKKTELANSIGSGRQFNEHKHVRQGGRFAPKAGTKSTTKSSTTKSSPQTAKAIIETLGLGEEFDIPGVDGSIKKTNDGYVITGPDDFETTASTAVAAMAVAARLIRENKKANTKTKAGAK